MEIPSNFTNPEALNSFIISSGIDTSSWGVDDGTKSIDELFEEVRVGETTFALKLNPMYQYIPYEGELDEKGDPLEMPKPLLHRFIRASEINIRSPNTAGQMMVLREGIQVWHDGSKRRRNLPFSISEKLKPEERPLDGIVRRLMEKLKLSVDEDQLASVNNKVLYTLGGSYAGLLTVKSVYSFGIQLDNLYVQNRQGFLETDEQKTTSFDWILEEDLG